MRPESETRHSAPICSHSTRMGASVIPLLLVLEKKATSLHLGGAGKGSLLLARSSTIAVKQQPHLAHLPQLEATDTMTPTLATFEDSTLIQRTLAGQSDCFAALIDRHLAAVKRRIGSMVQNLANREDLLQEVLLKVWLHLSTFRAESSFRTWITRVAINEALQSYRRERRRPFCQPLRDFDAIASTCDSPHHSLARVQETQIVRKAVAGLPAKYREVLILHDLEQRGAKETAQSLKSSVPAVKIQVHRARLMLRSRFGGRDGSHADRPASDGTVTRRPKRRQC
jgi:RNA polymerase sigma-70 factor (ECF subfamily)